VSEAHLQPLRALHRGQNALDLARWGRRLVVVKRRRTAHRHRHQKEADWLLRARELGIPVPPLLGAFSDQRGHHLLLPPAPADRRAWSPSDWLTRLRSLHELPAPAGWGPLRADGRPRWPDRERAATWYAERARGLTQDPEPILAALAGYWEWARPRLIHGDVHHGNRAGAWIIDWEQVAVADPWEEAARAALAGGWGPSAWAAACGAQTSDPRWQGALVAAAVEAASCGGPRAEAGRRVLLGLGSLR
jgi:hypothetical protein